MQRISVEIYSSTSILFPNFTFIAYEHNLKNLFLVHRKILNIFIFTNYNLVVFSELWKMRQKKIEEEKSIK